MALWVWILAVALAQDASPPEDPSATDPEPAEEPKANPVRAYYDRGLTLESRDGNWKMKVELRGQFRISYPLDDDATSDRNPIDPGDLQVDPTLNFRIRRARLRWGGHAFRPWVRYYFEFDWVNPRILDLRMTVGPSAIQVRLGQWKAEFSRERRASSREQQLVDRSIVNDWFTVDRQVGITVLGHLFEGSPGDLRYYIGGFAGWGARTMPDSFYPMVVGRLQWNFLGRDLELAQGDLELRERPAASLALGGVHNRSPFTSFDGGGGSQLPGYAADGDYSINQGLVELAFKWRGFSFQSEVHLKNIEDHGPLDNTLLAGGYVQAGWLPAGVVRGFPKQLELALRAALVDPDTSLRTDRLWEYGVGLNSYFAGHRNKLNADFTYFDYSAGTSAADAWRLRLQWEISL